MSSIGPNVRLHSLENLSERKFRFCEAFLANGHNVKEAARTAGYSSSNDNNLNRTGYRILKDKDVARYLNKRIKKLEKEIQLDLNYKVKKLKKIMDVGIPDDADILDPEMTKLALSAIGEHNKMVGDIAPVKNANINCDVALDQLIIEISNDALKEY